MTMRMPPRNDRATYGPLRVCAANPRYFEDQRGQPLFLTGSHTWATLQERQLPETPVFDYARWLDFMESHNHNFLRMWTWEHAAWMQFTKEKVVYSPSRYRRPGPGLALDGLPKFDLAQFNEDFFVRLRQRIEMARERGIYVALMFFQGFSLDKTGSKETGHNFNAGGNAFRGHPMHKDNNINGIDGDPNGSGSGNQVHTLDVPEITRLQEAYIRKTIDTLDGLDNVIWEISNESHAGSVQWQYHMIRYIHEYEKTKSMRRPVGMTGAPIENPELYASEAEWISPRCDETNPPAATGEKVLIWDTDHTGPFNEDPKRVWKGLCQGQSFIAMDYYMDCRIGSPSEPIEKFEPIRRQMGHALRYARRIDLAASRPRGDLASSGYCLAVEGRQYLAYLPDGGSVSLDLTGAPGNLWIEWFDPEGERWQNGGQVRGGQAIEFAAPFEGHAVLYATKTT